MNNKVITQTEAAVPASRVSQHHMYSSSPMFLMLSQLLQPHSSLLAMQHSAPSTTRH